MPKYLKHYTMSYKQYYCNESQGMRLRSGTVINCLASSTFYRDFMEAISYSTREYRRDGDYTQKLYCLSLQAVLSVLEKHAESIANNPSLLKFHKMALVKLPQFAGDIKKHDKEMCKCCETDRFWRDMWKTWRYKVLSKVVDQRHTNAESIERVERLYQYFENARIRKERQTMRALTTFVNEDCARTIMAYI